MATRDQLNEQKRLWKIKNPERMKAYRRKWYEKNRDRVLAEAKARNATLRSHRPRRDIAPPNPEKIRAEKRRWYAQHRDAMCARTKQWKAANPDKVRAARRAYRMKYRALLKGVPISDLKAIRSWVESWRYADAVECAYCARLLPGRQCHAEHVVPLSRGGPHTPTNLVVSCPDCNLSKHAKTPAEWRGAT